ncbi:MAG: hypothetical protein JXA67_07550, partial [Micromonosporaceae bacterium]|nr:hypothetical protein [Micromonosporaceae bacterium]
FSCRWGPSNFITVMVSILLYLNGPSGIDSGDARAESHFAQVPDSVDNDVGDPATHVRITKRNTDARRSVVAAYPLTGCAARRRSSRVETPERASSWTSSAQHQMRSATRSSRVCVDLASQPP